jgi:hypothetical protein
MKPKLPPALFKDSEINARLKELKTPKNQVGQRNLKLVTSHNKNYTVF